MTAFLLVCLACGVVATLSLVAAGFAVGRATVVLDVPRLACAVGWTGAVIWLLRWARRGRLRGATAGGLALLAVVGLAVSVTWTIELPVAIMLAVLFVLLAGLLLEGRAARCAIAGYLFALVVIDIAHFAGAVPSASDWLADPRAFGSSVLTLTMLLGMSGVLLLIRRDEPTPIRELVSADPEHSPLARSRTSALSRRETDVTILVAGGKTDRQIAEELVISPRTVGTHVGNALRKTGCANRTGLALLAVEEGLVQADALRIEAGNST